MEGYVTSTRQRKEISLPASYCDVVIFMVYQCKESHKSDLFYHLWSAGIHHPRVCHGGENLEIAYISLQCGQTLRLVYSAFLSMTVRTKHSEQN